MIMRSIKVIYGSVSILFLLMVLAGCAQTKAGIREGTSGINGGKATIQAVKVSSDASQIEITADKPLSYTYYKMSEPPKVVIDLAQTDPGAVTKALDVNAGNIKRIEVVKHDFTGGFLSRVEIVMAKEQEFSASLDAEDKGKLVVTFARPPADQAPAKPERREEATAVAQAGAEPKTAEKQAVVEPTVLTVEEIKSPPETKQLQEPAGSGADVKKEEKGPAAEAAKETAAEILPSKPLAPQAKVLRAVAPNSVGIVLSVEGGVDAFNAFKLTRPDRLVIDLPGVKNGIAVKSVAIDRFGAGQARLGGYPDKVRVVIDAAKASLQSYRVVKDAAGIKVLFGDVAMAAGEGFAKGAVKPAAEPQKEPAKETPKPQVAAKKAKVSAIEDIDFKIVEDYSQISIKVSGDCNVDKPVKVADGLVLVIRNCLLPARFQRQIDTSAFPSAVKGITPYQIKVKNRADARILVKLRNGAPFNFKLEGDTIFWNVKNPETRKTLPAPPVEAARTKPETVAAPAVSTAAQGEKAASAGEMEVVPEKQQVAATKAGEKKIFTGRRVSLEFSDAEIRKILQLIAEVSNLNFLLGDDVSGTISIKLVNVPWDQALDVILETKNLEKRQEGNIMYIKPKGRFKTQEQEEAEVKKEREKRMELKTKVFEINFAAIGDVASQFDKLKSERGSISQDARTNRVIVTDIEDRIRRMVDLLKELDTPEKQVMIEARIVEATSTFTRDLGVQWGVHYRDGSGSFMGINQVDTGFGGIVSPPPSSGTSGPGSAVGMSFGKLTSNLQLDLRLSAAATVGQIKIISTPKVVTLNNKAAKISQGQSIPYQTTSAEGTKTEFVEAALTLEVTPHISADGSISMKIKASNNSPGTGTPPPINKKEATTEVQVMNGETTVIGGIYTDNDTDSNTGVPFLQDIPLLGWLFKSNTKSKTKTELLIFITPKVIS
jgi:type IV pilus assembly protein PilQ